MLHQEIRKKKYLILNVLQLKDNYVKIRRLATMRYPGCLLESGWVDVCLLHGILIHKKSPNKWFYIGICLLTFDIFKSRRARLLTVDIRYDESIVIKKV